MQGLTTILSVPLVLVIAAQQHTLKKFQRIRRRRR